MGKIKKGLLNLGIVLSGIFFLSACTEVELASHVAKSSTKPTQQGSFKVGNPYKIQGKTYHPQESYVFEETGIASWYGPDFHGKKTANGEIYNMNELTAAHRTLQMPSLVRVTNLENGRSIIVRINDRGPFSKGRVIDVSKKGAELLGFKNKGTAKVKLQVLGDESRQIAEAAKQGRSTKGVEVAMNERGYQPISQRAPAYQPPYAPSVQPASVPTVEMADINTVSVPGHVEQGRFYPDPVVKQFPVSSTNIFVQVGSFGNPANAENLASSLQALGQTQIQPAIVRGRNFYRVRIGPMGDVPQADEMLANLAQRGHKTAIIVVD